MNSVLYLSILILLIEFLSDNKLATFKNTIMLFVCSFKISHKHCLHFLWDLVWSQEKTKAILMQNFGGTNKEYYGIFKSGLCHLPLPRSCCSLVRGPPPALPGSWVRFLPGTLRSFVCSFTSSFMWMRSNDHLGPFGMCCGQVFHFSWLFW